jgi:hypothetical protein
MRRLGTSTTASLVRPPGGLDELGETVIEIAVWETLDVRTRRRGGDHNGPR